jgi:hypothetical protein
MGEEDQRSPEMAFLLEEYKNIAATHDKLRDLIVRLFNYFLLLNAFPFTVLGIMARNHGLDLWSPPRGVRPLFAFIGAGDLLLTLTLIDARLSQYRYAKTVNLIRKYFADISPTLRDYLYLPVDATVPRLRNLGYVRFQVVFMTLTGMLSVAYAATALSAIRWPVLAGGAYLVVLLLVFWRAVRGYEKHRGIK